MKTQLLVLFLYLATTSIHAQEHKKVVINDSLTVTATIKFTEDFENNLNKWKAQQEIGGGSVSLNKGKMEITTNRGCTVWFSEFLEGPIMIEYDAVMIDEGGKLDRVSDLNCFFMASDPNDASGTFINKDELKGALGDYNKLKLYYVGQGGRKNTTVRMRKYPGDGTRPMLPEHDLKNKEYLLKGNVVNHIKIIVYNNIVQYYRDNQLIFDFYDTKPLTKGYFGFRTTINHMYTDNFKVFQLGI